jgi:hypothetical protein
MLKLKRNWILCRQGLAHLIGSEPKIAPLQFNAAIALSACKGEFQINILQETQFPSVIAPCNHRTHFHTKYGHSHFSVLSIENL